MKTRLNNILALLLISGAFLFAAAQASQEYNKIDAFTSASPRKSLKVDSIIVFRTKAIIYWSEYWDDDMEVLAYRLKWGTAATSFQDSINKKPYVAKTKITDTLQPLVENTEYVGQFYRDYNRKLFNLDFKFNTPPLANPPVGIISSSPHPKLLQNVSEIEVFSINGKQVLSTKAQSPAATLHSIKNPGLYIVKEKGLSGRLIRSQKILIGG